MRDKIANYLEKAGQSMPAERILRDVLNIHSPNSLAADRVLKSIVGGDARFHRTRGLWNLAAVRTIPGTAPIAALFLQQDAGRPLCFRGAIHFPATGKTSEFQRTEASIPGDTELLKRARVQAGNHLLLIWRPSGLRQWNRLLRAGGLPGWDGESLSVSRLAGRAFPESTACEDPADLASCLGLASPDADSPPAMARFIAGCFQSLLDHVPPERRAGPKEIEDWISQGRARVDFSRFAFGRDFLSKIPESPGVYLMHNRAAEVIYIGKSHNLRRRVRSYFTSRALADPKVARIHVQLYSLEFLTCETEVEALLLEMRMIRDFRPAINLQTEIHERPSRYGRGSNLLLLVPAGDRAEIYFLKEGLFVGRKSVPLGSKPSKALRNRIQAIYFTARPGRAIDREEWETEIVARFLATHRRRLNLVDVDEAGSLESAVRRVEAYLGDPDRLSKKVYYR